MASVHRHYCKCGVVNYCTFQNCDTSADYVCPMCDGVTIEDVLGMDSKQKAPDLSAYLCDADLVHAHALGIAL